MRAIRLVGAAALVAALAFGLGARADQEPPGGAEEAAAAPAPAVKIAIAEKVDGRESRYMVATYFVRKKLREAGLRAWSTEKLPNDDKEHEAAVAEARARGEEPPVLLEEAQPEPALVIEGTCDVAFDRSSTFYGADLAAIYKATLDLKIKGPSGAVLDEVHIVDEFGKKNKKAARNGSLKRIGMFAAVDVLLAEPVRAHMSDEAKAAAQPFIDKINKDR